MNIEYLIIGQGISGSFLAYELEKAGLSYLLIDQPNPFSASRVASGIINPVTGRRIVKTWMIDELMPVAWESYRQLGKEFGIDCIRMTGNIDFFPTPQMRLAFLDRFQENAQYLTLPANENDWLDVLNYSFGYGTITPCYLVNMPQLLPAFRKHFSNQGTLREENFDQKELILNSDGIEYQDIKASKVIFCDGVNGQHNKWLKNLPFAPNKGEALIVEIMDLPAENILKKAISLVPWQENLFWVGSSHEWQFQTEQPTIAFREKTEAQLKGFLKVPFKVVDHWASVRPATLERRPFVGFHPAYPQVGLFNGLGTKGCSLAPYFANQLAQQLTTGTALLAEVNINRFKRVLARE